MNKQTIGISSFVVCWHVCMCVLFVCRFFHNFFFFILKIGGLAEIRFESNISYPHPHGGIESSAKCYAQWPQYVEIKYSTRAIERFR